MKGYYLLRYIAYVAVCTALVFVATIAIAIPIPSGAGAYLNFGDIVIFISASILGPLGGFICGGIGSMFADLMYSPIFAILTIIVKGTEGFVVGLLVKTIRKKFTKPFVVNHLAYIISFIVGAVIMFTGYFLGTGVMLGVIGDGDYKASFITALANVPNDLIQASVSIAVGYGLLFVLLKIRYIRNIQHSLESAKRPWFAPPIQPVTEEVEEDGNINEEDNQTVEEKNNIENS